MMPVATDFILRFSRRYCMGHRLTSDAAPCCRVPHGHDEVVTVELVAPDQVGLNPETNMLVEFDRAKGRWFEWIDDAVDHSFQINAKDPLVAYFIQNESHLVSRLMLTPGDPTTEVRAACYKAKLACFLREEVPQLRCLRLTIQETPTNAVVCEIESPEKILPEGNHWWTRADNSINDL